MALRAFGDGKIFGQIAGDAPARVLALHGWGRRSADFGPALEGLSYVAVDLPGFGASPPPTAPVGAAGYAVALAPVLEVVGHPAVLLGHSFGGRVALHMAAAMPDRWSALVLSGVPLLRRAVAARPPLPFRMARWAARHGLVSDPTMERFRRRYGSADYRAARGVMRQVLVIAVNESYEEQLTKIKCPVRMIWGADDSEVPVSVAERAARLLAGGGVDVSVTVLAGAGHLLPLTHPDGLRRVVVEMLGR